jgi:hypothetical protein
MFAEAIGHEDEGYAITGEDRAEGHQPGLRLSAGGFAIPGTAKELDQSRYVGQVDRRTIDRQHAKEVLPTHAGREVLLVSLVQSAPEGFPKTQGESGPRQTESLFGDAFVGHPRTKYPDMPPGRAESLRHGLTVQGDEHHEPAHDFGDQIAPSLGGRPGLLRDGLELTGGKDVPKGRQTEGLHQGSSQRLVRADRRHEKASLHEPDRDGPP